MVRHKCKVLVILDACSEIPSIRRANIMKDVYDEAKLIRLAFDVSFSCT